LGGREKEKKKASNERGSRDERRETRRSFTPGHMLDLLALDRRVLVYIYIYIYIYNIPSPLSQQ